MYIKYTGPESKYSDGTRQINTHIIDMSEVFSIQSTSRLNVNEVEKKGKIVEKRITEDGHVTLYKTDKTYHQFYFKSWKNIDDFVSQTEQCLGKNRGDNIVLIEIDHMETPVKVEKMNNEEILA